MPFAAYGKYGVGKTRTQIPRRVYGEASRTAQADTNHGDERSDHKWIEPLREAVRSDEEYAHNEDHSADHLADEVIAARPYGGRSTKGSASQGRRGGGRPVRAVLQPHQYGSDKGAGKLSCEVARDLIPRKSACDSQPQGYSRVDMRATELAHCIDCHTYGESPSYRNGEPAGIF